jgi:sigma-B regulation protein RsbU (phosphoserine phosphatase)
MSADPAQARLFAPKAEDWRVRLTTIVDTMRELSRQTDPLAMSKAYAERIRRIFPTDRFLALSRRELDAPRVRITRCSDWTEEINPWKERDRLPVYNSGLLSDLIYSDEPQIIDELKWSSDDPTAQYFAGMGSLIAIPHYDHGVALNMVILMRQQPRGFPHEELPEQVWINNLYGRATLSLVKAEEARSAYDTVDRELITVADMQRSLLPRKLPTIPTLGIAAHYQTSRRAGGDYYDFFPLPDGHWGILIADVSGHGTPAAVIMAVTHAIAHTYAGPATPPGELLAHINRVLSAKYTARSGTFVTAFYGIYDPSTKTITYASAGHPPPRLKRCQDGSLGLLDAVQRLPLGVYDDETYPEATAQLIAGDQLVFYTDGITEAHNTRGEMFGLDQLDRVLENCGVGAADILKEVLAAVDRFTDGKPADDDRTVLVAKVK